MKKKIKRGIALLLLGMTLSGSVLTAQAETRAVCTSHVGYQKEGDRSTTYYTHSHNGKTCRVTEQTQYYNVVCEKCGVLLKTIAGPTTETHVY